MHKFSKTAKVFTIQLRRYHKFNVPKYRIEDLSKSKYDRITYT